MRVGGEEDDDVGWVQQEDEASAAAGVSPSKPRWPRDCKTARR